MVQQVDSEVTFDAVIDAVAPPFDAPIQIILDFEPQNKFYPGYPILKRSIFYAASLIHGQYGKIFNKSHYEKIRKVIDWKDENALKRGTIARAINRDLIPQIGYLNLEKVHICALF